MPGRDDCPPIIINLEDNPLLSTELVENVEAKLMEVSKELFTSLDPKFFDIKTVRWNNEVTFTFKLKKKKALVRLLTPPTPDQLPAPFRRNYAQDDDDDLAAQADELFEEVANSPTVRCKHTYPHPPSSPGPYLTLTLASYFAHRFPPTEGVGWALLTNDQRSSALLLGYNEIMWNKDEKVESLSKPWAELTMEEQSAWQVLGWSAEQWMVVS